MDPTLRFVELMNGPTPNVDLALGALLLSSHANPALDIEAQTLRLDDLAAMCPDHTLEGLLRYLFHDLGFSGNSTDYYDPANSFLDLVLDQRRGLPITLSVVTIEVGRRIGVELEGVGMPGHFLLRTSYDEDVFVDPFSRGRILDPAGCQEIFHRVAGAKAQFHDDFLTPIPATAILARMTANLVNAYRRASNRYGLRWAARLRARCPGVTADEMAQLGQGLVYSGAFDEGAALFENAAELRGGDIGAGWKKEAERQRARLN